MSEVFLLVLWVLLGLTVSIMVLIAGTIGTTLTLGFFEPFFEKGEKTESIEKPVDKKVSRFRRAAIF